MKKLPIGIQTFQQIREENFCYVDKTELISRLVEEGKYYFLSRPRRFGKSLLIDTIAEAFAGNRKLFTGLYLENNWDWKRKVLLSGSITPAVSCSHVNGWMKKPISVWMIRPGNIVLN